MMRRLVGVLRRRAVLCLPSWLCAAWLAGDWAWRFGVWSWRAGAHVLPDVPVAAMTVLLVVLPCAPVAVSLAVVACGGLFVALPVPGPDVNWLSSVPVCLALAVLGHRWRSAWSVAAALVLGCLPGLLGAVSGFGPLSEAASSVQACAMWWCVGAMAGRAVDAERAGAVRDERSRQREHRLRMLGLLHDSLANDLVGALLRCRAVVSRRDVDVTALAGMREVGDILERSLTRLREDVLAPERALLDGGAGPVGAGPEDSAGDGAVPTPGPCLSATAAELDRWLESRGWKGLVRVSGDLSDVDAASVRLAERCVRELGVNMLKHGSPGAFALEVDVDGDRIRVFASNPVARGPAGRDAVGRGSVPATDGRGGACGPCPESVLSSDCGLALLRRELDRRGGSLRWADESGEWTVYAVIPCVVSAKGEGC